ncbi:MAG: beta-hexosaminidase [Oscillospiraceae bacterium]|nr:beta-hexosaminidase [Oscillospiraceae bacterium]
MNKWIIPIAVGLFAVLAVFVYLIYNLEPQSFPTLQLSSQTAAESAVESEEEQTSSEPVDHASLAAQASAAYEAMSLEERVGQLIIARNPEGTKKDKLEDLLKEYPLGGLCLFKADFADKSEETVKNMIQKYQDTAKTPLLIAVDEEGGNVVRVSANPKLRAEPFASPKELFETGELEAIKADAKEKSQLLKALGINVNFAPVADAATDPNAFMYERAFGETIAQTSTYVSAVVTEMKAAKLGCTLKHFPGYGNSTTDTHVKEDVNKKTLAQLEAEDLLPFKRGISAGAESIMISHSVVNAIDESRPASLSPKVYEYIRQTMGFNGILITDGLDMDGIKKYSKKSKLDPAVEAIIAGADIALLPKDIEASYKALLKAAKDGSLTEERLEEACKHVLIWKALIEAGGKK